MSGAVHSLDGETLPETLPLFPLTGVLLLPHGNLPLCIFEPRYLNLTIDALGRGRMIGMVQPRHAQPDPLADDTELYRTGCAGRIVSFAETEDGRYLITLLGVSRFRILDELEPASGYRRAHAGYEPFAGDLGVAAGATDRPRLLKAVKGFFRVKGLDADDGALDSAPDEALVTSLSMLCPFDPREKQALLECADLSERGRLLTELMEMAQQETTYH
jgi:Lon protease-like protein